MLPRPRGSSLSSLWIWHHMKTTKFEQTEPAGSRGIPLRSGLRMHELSNASKPPLGPQNGRPYVGPSEASQGGRKLAIPQPRTEHKHHLLSAPKGQYITSMSSFTKFHRTKLLLTNSVQCPETKTILHPESTPVIERWWKGKLPRTPLDEVNCRHR